MLPLRNHIVTQRNGIVTRRNDIVMRRNDIVTRRNGIVTRKNDIVMRRNGIVTLKNHIVTQRNHIVIILLKSLKNRAIKNLFLYKKRFTNETDFITKVFLIAFFIARKYNFFLLAYAKHIIL